MLAGNGDHSVAFELTHNAGKCHAWAMMGDAVIAETGATLGELIHQRSRELTTAERRVARTLFATNLVAGFDTVAGLAARSHVSGPTVLRFVSKLGFSGYAEFQRALRHDLAARIDSPLRLYSRSHSELRSGHVLDAARARLARVLDSTFANLPQGEFDAVVDQLADRRRTVWMVGGRRTQAGAEILHAHLYRVRPRAQMFDVTPSGRVNAVLEVSRKDVVVVFDVKRYQKDTFALAESIRDRGATIVLITDPWLSPIADFASNVLTFDVDAPSPYGSMVSCVALIEVLVAGIVERLGESARRRVAEFERLRESYTWDDGEIPM